MYLQRLTADDEGCGLNYDYMGHAEFEQGATRIVRVILAKHLIANNIAVKRVNLVEKFGVSDSKPVDVFVFGSKEAIKDFGTVGATNPTIETVRITTYKTSMRADSDKIVGWLSVRTDEPLLIVKASQLNAVRADKFIQNFVDGILEEEKEAQKRIRYEFDNGWTITREGDQWVLRNDLNSEIARDSYFGVIMENHGRRLGDPVPTED